MTYILPSFLVTFISLFAVLLPATMEARHATHIIAVLVQVTMLATLVEQMPAIGYSTWLVGWAFNLMLGGVSYIAQAPSLWHVLCAQCRQTISRSINVAQSSIQVAIQI